MKNNSLTSKGVGDTIVEGEFVGFVGSSGLSTGPHCHFELHDTFGNYIDPFSGPCNPNVTTSYWRSQVAYTYATVNALRISLSAPSLPSCPQVHFSKPKIPNKTYSDRIRSKSNCFPVFKLHI